MGIKSINTGLCAGCGTCDRACPMDVIYFCRQLNRPVIKYPKDCQSCFLCAIQCPAQCIEVNAKREQEIPMPY